MPENCHPHLLRYFYTSSFLTALRCLGILLTAQQFHCTEAFICLWFQLSFPLFALLSESVYSHNAIALGKVFAAILLSSLMIKVFPQAHFLFACTVNVGLSVNGTVIILLLLSLSSKPRVIMVPVGQFSWTV